MLRSMTGFGSATREEGDLVLHAEIRSVNHRHLLVKSRLTGEFSFLESDVESRCVACCCSNRMCCSSTSLRTT